MPPFKTPSSAGEGEAKLPLSKPPNGAQSSSEFRFDLGDEIGHRHTNSIANAFER